MSDPGSVAGVLLAAGQSDRFGDANKLMAPLDGRPLVRHGLETLTAADLDAVAAVVDPDSAVAGEIEAFAEAIETADTDVALVDNPGATQGQATSVRRGVEWARGDHDAVLFALGDMPRVSPVTVDQLVAAWRRGEGSALAAGYEGERGNPVLFDGRHFDSLARVDGDVGGRDVFRTAADSAVVETDDPGVLVDVDTRTDLEALRNERES